MRTKIGIGTALAFFLSPLPAQAAPQAYQLQLEIYRKGKLLSRPRLVAREGQQAELNERSELSSSHLDVIATEVPGQGVKLAITVAFQDRVERRRVGGQPTIIAKEGEPAEISLSPSPGAPPELSLRITAKKLHN